ncbi:MAG: dihydrolipoyl dehydrogenase [Thermodesulfovibrionales bacterium]|nr:dihydrolipoyl dehydrogenase [Thermodesulfovibrionales bacterium]
MSLVVIGSGPGGYVAAIKAAQLGQSVTIIEDTEVGGTCLNRGCIPTKALIASTSLLSKARELDKYGIDLNGTVSPNLEKIMARKDKIVSTQVKGIRGLFKSWGIKLLEGKGRLLEGKTVEVLLNDGSSISIEADNIIIATGSSPAHIPAFPVDGINVLTSDHALVLTEIPKSMVIVGAGVIGCEWAFIFRELGALVTVVEMLPRALATEDTEVSALIAREMKKKKIKLMTETSVSKVVVESDHIVTKLLNGPDVVAEKMLVSIGRAFNSTGLGLEEVGVKTGKSGEILVDEQMRTNIKGVYAVGDVTGGMLLAHTASAEGIIAARNICGQEVKMDYSCIPAAIFTSPEIASVGLRDFQVHEMGIKTRTGMFQYRALGKAHAIGEIVGFFKIIADEETDRVLGAHVVGSEASVVIHEAAVAIRNGLTSKDLARTIHAHPTLSEGLMEAAEDVHGEAIHLPKK